MHHTAEGWQGPQCIFFRTADLQWLPHVHIFPYIFPSNVGVSWCVWQWCPPQNMMFFLGKRWSSVGFEGSHEWPIEAPPSWSQLPLWQGRDGSGITLTSGTIWHSDSCWDSWPEPGELGADCLGVGSSLQVPVHLLSGADKNCWHCWAAADWSCAKVELHHCCWHKGHQHPSRLPPWQDQCLHRIAPYLLRGPSTFTV